MSSSCELFERTRHTPPTRRTPTTQTDPRDTASIVTIEPADPDDVDVDIKVAQMEEERLRRDRDLPAGPDGAQISVMMPFFGDGFASTTGTLPQNSEWALQYYAGLKLGLEELEREGERAIVHVFDTRGDDGTAQRLMSDADLRGSHAIIGPYLAAAARAAATPAKAAALPFVVPYSASTGIADSFPRLVQLNPGLLAHLDAMAAYLSSNFDADQVVLVGLPTGEQNNTISYLQSKHAELAQDQAAWRTWQLNTSDVGMQGLEWEGKFTEDKQTVFVFPAYRRPKVVLSFLSQLQIGRAENDATVFGLPQWKEFDQLDPSLLEDLGIFITAGLDLDVDSPLVQQFADSYVSRYGAMPELPSYLGYDAIRLIVPLANRYGRAWVEHLPRNFPRGLASKYALQPVYSGASSEGEPERFENRSIEVLQYRNYAFEVVR